MLTSRGWTGKSQFKYSNLDENENDNGHTTLVSVRFERYINEEFFENRKKRNTGMTSSLPVTRKAPWYI